MTFTELDSPDALTEFINSNDTCVVTFSATWCGPCRAIEPRLKSLNRNFGGHERFELIGMNLDDSKDSPSSYVERRQLGWKHASTRRQYQTGGDWTSAAGTATGAMTCGECTRSSSARSCRQTRSSSAFVGGAADEPSGTIPSTRSFHANRVCATPSSPTSSASRMRAKRPS